MIEISTEALSKICKKITIFLPTNLTKKEDFKKKLDEIENLSIEKITFVDKKLIKFGYLRSGFKEILEKSNIIFLHNASLVKSMRSYFPKKKMVLFFHTDKISQLKEICLVDKVLSVNKTMTKNINLIKENQAVYLPNCINIKNTSIVPKNINSSIKSKPSELVVGAMGRLVKKKGFKFLIDACSEMKEIKLLIAGTGIEYNSLTKASINKNNIKLLGWTRNKEQFFKKIDIFCCSSEVEPFGLVIIEAMSRGIPVISTNCNGPRDIISNKKNGILININNKVELKKAITELKINVKLRKKLSENAKSDFEKKYTFQKYKKNLNYIIRNL